MKLPNFRLPTTQATFSTIAALVGLAILALLGVLVFYGLSTDQQWVIPYNPEGIKGRYRPGLVWLFTAFGILVGITAALLGFRSLGQARNTKQGYSWIGMLVGALVLALAPVMFVAWRTLSEAMIVKRAVDL